MVANWLVFLCMAVYASGRPIESQFLRLNEETQKMLNYIFEHKGRTEISDKVNVTTPQTLTEECKRWNLVSFNESLNTVLIHDKVDGDDIGNKLRVRLHELTDNWPQKNSVESNQKCQTLPKTPMQFLEQLKTFLKELFEDMRKQTED